MFNRLREVIDSQIQYEKDRQQQHQNQPSLLATRRTGSPAPRRGIASRSSSANRPKNDPATPPTNEKEKDPSEFESVDVIGGGDEGAGGSTGVPSRAGTPVAAGGGGGDLKGDEKQSTNGEAAGLAEGSGKKTERDAAVLPASKSGASTPTTSAANGDGLPTDIKVKLRRLDKIEPKYSDLLRSYKIVYAKMQAIEPFEKALRENTPCTSIADPNSLVEYLNNLSRRSDLTMEEFRRVSKERDELRKQSKEALERHKKETAKLNEELGVQKAKIIELETKAAGSASSSTALAPLLRSSLASPRTNPDSAGDIFSFEDERERLEADLEKVQLKLREATEARAVAEETVQRNLEAIENAQRELTGLKESGQAKDREIGRLTAENKGLSDQKAERVKELQEKDSLVAQQKVEIMSLKTEIDTAKTRISELEQVKSQEIKDESDLERLEKELESLQQEKVTLAGDLRAHEKQLERANKTSDGLLVELEDTKSKLGKRVRELEDKLTATMEKIVQQQQQLSSPKPKTNMESKESPKPSPSPSEPATTTQPSQNTPAAGGNKKKRKGKYKGGKNAGGAQQPPAAAAAKQEVPTKATETIVEDEPPTPIAESVAGSTTSDLLVEELKSQLSELREQLEDKEFQLSKMRKRVSETEALKDEVESLRESLIEVAQEHVEGRDQIKVLQAKRRELETAIARLKAQLSDKEQQLSSSQKGILLAKEQFNKDLEIAKSSQAADLSEKDTAYKMLLSESEVLKQQISALQSDFFASQQLAATRFRDITELKEVLGKKEQDLIAQRVEVATLGAAKNEANQKLVEMKKLEKSESNLKQEVAGLKGKLSDREKEIENLKEKVKIEAGKRTKAEGVTRGIQKELRSAQEGEKDAISLVEKASRELTKAQEEINSLRPKMQVMEREFVKLKLEKDQLLENLQLKTAQHAAAQSLVSSMQDQTSELAMQMKETKEKWESLEEELAETHRLLAERSRDAETMRRLLANVESTGEGRLREMKEQMEAAVEERDRAVEEAATIGQKKAREIDELRDRVKEAERSLKKADEVKEALEKERTSYLTGREKVEGELERLQGELKETKKAMEQMRDALDQTEAQIRASESQKAELKKTAEQYRQQHERLLKAHKDELRSKRIRPMEGGEVSGRSSIDSVRQPNRMASPPAVASSNVALTGSGGVLTTINADYLKNVLLQFMGQRDKKRQQQLIPVLSQLLKFDGADEQKWRAAVDAR